MNRPAMKPRCAQAGFGLIEVLVSILVLAVGMLGIAAMQATALRNSQSSYERTQGVVESYSIIDSMRANRAEALIGTYNLADWTCEAPDSISLATSDLRGWIESMQSPDSLGPSACGQIDCDGDGCLVRVRWSDARGSGDSANYDLDQYVVETRTLL